MAQRFRSMLYIHCPTVQGGVSGGYNSLRSARCPQPKDLVKFHGRHFALKTLEEDRPDFPSETDENEKVGWNLFHKAKRQLMMSCQSILTTVLFGRKRYLPPDGQP